MPPRPTISSMRWPANTLPLASMAMAPYTWNQRRGGEITRAENRRRRYWAGMVFAPPARHLLRAKDLADARYFEALDVDDMAKAAGLSRAHFSREFRRAFGESPHAYLLTRRLERAAALLRMTDRS